MPAARSRLTYYLAKGLTCKAELTASGIMHIEGNFHGTIRGAGVVIAGHHSVMDSTIEVDTVIVAGSFKGNIIAREKISILHCATVQGTVKSPVCDVEHGAKIRASMSIK